LDVWIECKLSLLINNDFLEKAVINLEAFSIYSFGVYFGNTRV